MAAITVMYGANVKISQLHYVRAVADLGSFSQAAISLGLSQPALSNGVATLESALGGPLFDRTTRGARPTDLAVLLLPHIDRVLASINALQDEARLVSGRIDEPLRMGVSPLIHPRLVGLAFEAARQGSDGGLVLKENNLVHLRTALLRKDLDLVLVPAVGEAQGLRRREVDAEPLHYIPAATSLNDQHTEPIELGELLTQRQVLVADECGLTTIVQTMFDRHGAPLQRYAGEAHSYRNLVEWAHLGLGGAILPKSRLDATTGAGRALVDAGVPIAIRYEALWLGNSRRTRSIEALLDTMLDHGLQDGP